jgi:hypothetical protein
MAMAMAGPISAGEIEYNTLTLIILVNPLHLQHFSTHRRCCKLPESLSEN